MNPIEELRKLHAESGGPKSFSALIDFFKVAHNRMPQLLDVVEAARELSDLQRRLAAAYDLTSVERSELAGRLISARQNQADALDALMGGESGD